MRREEAIVLADWIGGLDLPSGSLCLNIGSSTEQFRTQDQPHIDMLLLQPLSRAGLRILHCDMKADPGVDEVGDLLDQEFRKKLGSYNADLIICSNLLEHLTDPKAFAAACGELVKPGGYAVFTVPLSYPYHPDPIDTMLRLSPAELASLTPGWEVIKAEEIEAGSHLTDLKESGEATKRLAKHLLRVLMPFYRPDRWKPLAHRLLWLFRPFRQSLVLVRKPQLDICAPTNVALGSSGNGRT